MEKNLFEQAKDAMKNLMDMPNEPSQDDQAAAKSAIKAAYSEASPEEQQQLEQLEQELEQKNHLK